MKYILILIFMLSFITPAKADTYYCLLFSHDSKPISNPLLCHVWGTFICIKDGKLIEEVTINWGPEKHSYLGLARPGWNQSLEEALEFAKNKNRHIRMWGPFETKKDFFDKAKLQITTPGTYKFIDCLNRNAHQNCIHRLSDVAGPLKTGIYWGWWATDAVYEHFRRHGVLYVANNESEVISLLKLDTYKIQRIR